MELVTGINEDELGSLAMEILDYSERIADIFNKIDDNMETLGNYYKSPSYKELMNNYKNFSKNYEVLRKNVNSYSDDLINLIKKMRENDKYLANLFDSYTIEHGVEAKKIERL